MTTLTFIHDDSDGQFRVHLYATPNISNASINFQFTYTATTLVFDRLSVNGSSSFMSSTSHVGTQGQVTLNGLVSPSAASDDILATLHFDGDGSGTFDLNISSILISGNTPVYNDPTPFNYSVESLADTQAINLNEDSDYNGSYNPFNSFFGSDLSVDTTPSHGTIEIISSSFDGETWLYTPDDNYWGTDQFTVQARKPGGKVKKLVVDANIQPVNDLPVGTFVIVGTPVEGEILSANTSEIEDFDGLG